MWDADGRGWGGRALKLLSSLFGMGTDKHLWACCNTCVSACMRGLEHMRAWQAAAQAISLGAC
eukprot:365492-Chlamydomonas_euryale.AAC.5